MFKMSFEKPVHFFTGKDNLSAQYITEEFTFPDYVTYILTGLHISIVVICLTGNIMILASFLRKKRAKTNADCYLKVMAMSDIQLVACCVPFTVFGHLVNNHWIFGQFLCSAANYSQTVCLVQRSFTMVASSVDRYQAVRWPLQKQTSRLPVTRIIASYWIVSLILPIPVALFSKIVFHSDNNDFGTCLEVWPNIEYRRAFRIIMLVLIYFLPLVVLTITYTHIVLIVNTKPPGEEYPELVKRHRSMKRKTIKMFLLTVCSFAVCWLPIFAIGFIGDIYPQIYDVRAVHIMWAFAQCLAISNSAINPIITLTSKRNFGAKLHERLCFLDNSQRKNVTMRPLVRYSSVQVLKSNKKSDVSSPHRDRSFTTSF